MFDVTDETNVRRVAGTHFSIKPIGRKGDADGGGVRVTGRKGVTLLEIKVDDGLIADLSEQAGEEVLQAVAGVGKSLVTHAYEEDHVEDLVWFAHRVGLQAVDVVLESAPQDAAPRKRVDPKRIQTIERAAGRVIAQLVRQALVRDLSNDQLEEQAQAAVDTFEVLLGGDSRQLEALIDGLEPRLKGDPTKVNLDEARARGRLRLQALYRKIMQDSVTVADLREWGLSRQRVGQLRDEERLFAIKIPHHRELFHPRWQFTADHSLRPMMPTLLRAAKDVRLDAIGFHQLMTGKREGGRSGVELLDAGREDLALSLITASDR